MNRTVTLKFAPFAALLAACAVAPLASADDALPKADTILDRFIEVTGGKAAYLKHHSEIMTGTMEVVGRGVKGTMTTYAAEPDKFYAVIELEGLGKSEQGSADGIVWEKSSVQGPRIKDGVEKAEGLEEATFNAPVYWRKMYSKAETAGLETVDGEECYKVVLTTNAGKPVTEYFSKKSGLVVKRSRTAVTQMGEIPVEFAVADYKDFGGVLSPTKMTQKFAGAEILFTIQSVKTNAEIPPDRFALPDDVKALLKK